MNYNPDKIKMLAAGITGEPSYYFEPEDEYHYAKGGAVKKSRQWLKGVVENALQQYKRVPDTEQPDGQGSHLNNWIDSQLTRYVKNDFGAENDPLALMDPTQRHIEDWDTSIGPRGLEASWLQNSSDLSYKRVLEANPWVFNLDPQEIVYDNIPSRALGNFNHLIDEMVNSTRSDSDLPPELRLRPESLQRMSVPQASTLVGKINAWRKAQVVEANLAKSNNAATQLYKDYPDEGFKWVELRKPVDTGTQRKTVLEPGTTEYQNYADNLFDTPEGLEYSEQAYVMARKEGKAKGLSGDDLDDFTVDREVEIYEELAGFGKTIEFDEEEAYAQLKDALKYEGDVMQHCVGGYCDDVVSGESRIFSLRDSKGEPHVTIEVVPQSGFFDERLDEHNPDMLDEYEYEARLRNPEADEPLSMHDWLRDVYPKAYESIMSGLGIEQIKGKGNSKPNDKYLPYVQDFIRGGKWGSIGDMQNTGFVTPDKLFRIEHDSPLSAAVRSTSDIDELFNSLGRKYGTDEELTDEARKIWPDRFIDGVQGGVDDTQNFAEGGAVTKKPSLMETFKAWNDARPPVPEASQRTRPRVGSDVSDPGVFDRLKNAWDELNDLGYAVKAGIDTQYTLDDKGAPGLYLGTKSIPALSEIFVEGSSPDWAMDASNRYDKHLNDMLAKYEMPPTAELDIGDRYGVAAGEMLGQLPIPGSFFHKLKNMKGLKPMSYLSEYFGPIIEPRAINYAIGTGIGGTLRQIEGPDDVELGDMEAKYDNGDWLDRQPTQNFGSGYVSGYAKGGAVKKSRQWLNGTVEKVMDWYKIKSPTDALNLEEAHRALGFSEDEINQSLQKIRGNISANERMNKWIDSQLTKYVKNDLGAEHDPLAAMELLDTHYAGIGPDDQWFPSSMLDDDDGFDGASMSRHPVTSYLEGDGGQLYSEDIARENPWLSKLDPNESIYNIYTADFDAQTGFSHLIDELKNAVRYDSDLPQNLRLRPESLERVSVPQASKLVGEINAWRKAQMVEANQALANNAATFLHKDYPDEGFKWVQLKSPGKAPEGWEEVVDPGAKPNLDPDFAYNNKTLSDALKYEGDVMQHCVGGYCDDVVSGDTSIFSLRDSKGEPHVTIETKQKPVIFSDIANILGREEAEKMVDSGLTLREITKEIPGFERQIEINQIKGKGNSKPNDKYLPFVQDFVKSGKWGKVRDLRNSGLISRDSGNILPDGMLAGILNNLYDEGVDVPGNLGRVVWDSIHGDYATEQEIENAVRTLYPNALDPKPEGFAQGGIVQRQYNQERINALASQLM